MTDDQDQQREPAGTVAEEAAMLFSALTDWAKDHTGAAQAAVDGAAAAVHDIDEHIATGGEDCRYCPVCQVIHAVRETSPEVKAHLATAATSLVQAVAGLLATHVPDGKGGPRPPVEKIDLDDPEGAQ